MNEIYQNVKTADPEDYYDEALEPGFYRGPEDLKNKKHYGYYDHMKDKTKQTVVVQKVVKRVETAEVVTVEDDWVGESIVDEDDFDDLDGSVQVVEGDYDIDDEDDDDDDDEAEDEESIKKQ